jgi:hypothetical protein
MPVERRLISYIAMLIATVYFFFGRAEAATPNRPTVSGETCHQPPAGGKMIACKPDRPERPRS